MTAGYALNLSKNAEKYWYKSSKGTWLFTSASITLFNIITFFFSGLV